MVSPGLLAAGGMFENKLNEYGSNDMSISDKAPGGAFSKMVSDFGDNKISEVIREDSNNIPGSGISE